MAASKRRAVELTPRVVTTVVIATVMEARPPLEVHPVPGVIITMPQLYGQSAGCFVAEPVHVFGATHSKLRNLVQNMLVRLCQDSEEWQLCLGNLNCFAQKCHSLCIANTASPKRALPSKLSGHGPRLLWGGIVFFTQQTRPRAEPPRI
eukprot:CAMPEP_0172673740 /NCGR_PEP_ID=MMETSP1074-20121228/12333_1 /TAXON_ID=2916 /ORGANISM="Ceratium fusus, Strain PA161109" /LENGTH=148 /DNA_ID=CAMNT_0013491079 /DNA_START=655 /DNA_END=1101 /DNA_ORIENTATION=-